MSEKNWSIGFYQEFAVDFDNEHKDSEDYGWQKMFDNVLDGLNEPEIRVLHSLDAVRERPDLLPERNLYFAFEGSSDDFMEQMLENIVAFKLKVEKVSAKSKISQNREKVDFDSVQQVMDDLDKTSLSNAMKRSIKKKALKYSHVVRTPSDF